MTADEIISKIPLMYKRRIKARVHNAQLTGYVSRLCKCGKPLANYIITKIKEV